MRVFKLEMLGSMCVFDKLEDLFDDIKVALQDDNVNITISSFEMPEEEYKKTPEFQGY